ncbi:ParB/RepB/Spo0J family partition protein [Mycobacterium haemophilum]|uniref:Chromosome partitioning protein ParB n=1 Tax=Mycobacterium haemophilum TaxID=29311 RepID=A0A0I9UYX0_9MYCO|nr:ParB/RepB/Spo0J family partition protein [Mycobacterium haemophilum]AKN15701.1 chromosome partitioning protein ParB [Mycobacterium haemophilum DSM 44634]KLO28631.1 chromosome partitioning protein ParB [Mycobacterium haemophilum]KLO35520.1 chromosome partitioning protein ParB [Mycobacterium haemophilum]KLO40755.1 chromosome partitioning protein ParB [Mycobacterium haemophilum]KLO48131.1 chromosome partitioning protein ParB [Mycobacterium haemophilum]
MTQPLRKKGGLGRGLASLIPTGPADADSGPATRGPRMGDAAADVLIGGPAQDATAMGAVYREIAPTDIEANPRQPRQVFDDEAMSELVHSIREFGLLQPIVVRAAAESRNGARYQIVMGERRWRAAQRAGLSSIPAIVRATGDDNLLRDALLENIHRVQLNPLEEAAAYQQLLDEFEVTHDELASRIGRSRPLITNMIRLLKLPIPVQRRVAAGVLSAGHARALLSLEAGPEAQEELASRIIAEGLSVRATEEAVTLANHEANRGVTAPAPQRRKPIHMPGLQDVAERLSNAFDTRVTVSLGKRKGKIVVEFGSVDDLQRIIDVMTTHQT